MKKIKILTLILFLAFSVFAQEKEKIYDPDLNAKKQIEDAVMKAKAENKHVLLQVGGNWCSWCIKLNKFMKSDTQIDSLLNASYVFVHINYSKENKNMETMKKLGYPQRFGFPVLVLLDAEGNRIHTQNSAYLEQDKGYSKEKVFDFLKSWTPAALSPENYKE